MHPNKKYGRLFGMIPATESGPVFSAKAHTLIQIGKKEVKFFSLMEKVREW